MGGPRLRFGLGGIQSITLSWLLTCLNARNKDMIGIEPANDLASRRLVFAWGGYHVALGLAVFDRGFDCWGLRLWRRRRAGDANRQGALLHISNSLRGCP